MKALGKNIIASVPMSMGLNVAHAIYKFAGDNVLQDEASIRIRNAVTEATHLPVRTTVHGEVVIT